LFNRVSKTDGGTTTKYLVDPNGFLPQVIAEMDGAYDITSYYVYDGLGLVAKMAPSGSTYFYHYNGSGNTIAMTDSGGNMVNKYAYDEFGNLVNVEESVLNPFLFVGQYGVMDDDNGLLYMRARYYDPQVGRFINKDPIRYWGDLNLFTYVQNNPLNRVDPSGLWTISFGTTLMGAMGLGGWGGTFFNFGHDPSSDLSSGWSFSITGTVGAGVVAGIGGGLGVAVSGSNASNVQQLLGEFREGGTGFGRTGIGYFQSPDGCIKGSTLGMQIRGKMYGGTYVGGSNTSAIIQWVQGQGFSFLQ
jgi:RHS repeat-associated protein